MKSKRQTPRKSRGGTRNAVAARTKRGKGKPQLVTAAEARRRAAQYVVRRMFKGAPVRDGASGKLGLVYSGGWRAGDVWLVYKNGPGLALKPSDVVIVHKRTGRILYEGTINDEG